MHVSAIQESVGKSWQTFPSTAHVVAFKAEVVASVFSVVFIVLIQEALAICRRAPLADQTGSRP